MALCSSFSGVVGAHSDGQTSSTGWDIPSILSSLMSVFVTKREISLWLLFTCFVFKSELGLLFSIQGCLD